MNLARYLRYPDRRLALRMGVGAAIGRAGGAYLRTRAAPSLAALAEIAGGNVLVDPAALVTAVVEGGDRQGPSLADLVQEHDEITREISRRYQETSLSAPPEWAVEKQTSLLLYLLARIIRPESAVEIGVANGHSSFFLLRALARNGRGILHSFDIAPGCGVLVPRSERGQWDLRILNGRTSFHELRTALEALPPANLGFHDGDHGYLGQYLEYVLLWKHLAAGGVLVSDDVDASFGFIDFVKEAGASPHLLLDGRKMVAVTHRV